MFGVIASQHRTRFARGQGAFVELVAQVSGGGNLELEDSIPLGYTTEARNRESVPADD